MIPRVFNWVDMNDIDLAYIHGQTISGLYSKITSAVTSDGVAIFYNWKCANIPFPPSYVNISLYSDYLLINGLIKVTTGDVISIPGYDPTLVDLTVTENGEYDPSDYDAQGFSDVVVAVPEKVLLIDYFTENGTYTPPTGYDGWSQITINVPSCLRLQPISTNHKANIDGYNSTLGYYCTYDESESGEYDLYELPDLTNYCAYCYSVSKTGYSYSGSAATIEDPRIDNAKRYIAAGDAYDGAGIQSYFARLESTNAKSCKYAIIRHPSVMTDYGLWLIPYLVS